MYVAVGLDTRGRDLGTTVQKDLPERARGLGHEDGRCVPDRDLCSGAT